MASRDGKEDMRDRDFILRMFAAMTHRCKDDTPISYEELSKAPLEPDEFSELVQGVSELLVAITQVTEGNPPGKPKVTGGNARGAKNAREALKS